MPQLTERRRKFIEAYMSTGIATKAAEIAGYAHPNPAGARLLANGSIRAEIDKRVAKDPVAWGREELFGFWTEMANGKGRDGDRLKASELLDKAQAMFVQRHEVECNYRGKSDAEVLDGAIDEILGKGESVTTLLEKMRAQGYEVTEPDG